MVQSPCEISSAQFFKTIFGMPSGPIALCTSRRFNSFNTPLLSIIICEIGGVLLNLPTSGLILSVDLVNTEMNCFKRIFALDLASVSKFPLLFNGAVPILSCLLLFV